MGFDVYYLIVWDLCMYAKRRGIWWNVRGSGAGSIVAYAIGVTNLDPLRNKLIFERFLNPGRVTMPDFDLDFPDDQREELIRYTLDKYGDHRVAQIVTFGRMKARAAVRDVGRAMGVPLDEVDVIAKLIPGIPGKPVTIQDVLTPDNEFYSADLKQKYDREESVREPARHGEATGGRRPALVDPSGSRDRGRPRADPLHAADAPAQVGHHADGHAVRVPDPRIDRPAEDRLPGPRDPHADARGDPADQGAARHRVHAAQPADRRSEDVRAADGRRRDGRLPGRRRRACGAC